LGRGLSFPFSEVLEAFFSPQLTVEIRQKKREKAAELFFYK